MFCKLAFQNVRKSLRDYAVYFMTLTLGVCIFYVFNSVESQQAMLDLNASQSETMLVIVQLINMTSVFVSFILAFLILYANKFMIRRRKKELGIYMTLGMPKGKISAVLLLETLIIGAFSLFAGLLIGVLLSQGLAVVTASMFAVQIKQFRMVFSMDACLKSLLYFGIIFLVVMLFNSFSISRRKLIDLLNAERKNEELKIKKLWLSVLLFLVSVGVLAVAYERILRMGVMNLDREFGITIALGILGTLLFFLSLSGFLLRVVQSNRRLYLKNLNMFVLRQFNSKINTTYLSMTVICLMLLMTIGVLSVTTSYNNSMQQMTSGLIPYDATFLSYDDPEHLDIGDTLDELAIPRDELFRESYEYKTWETGVSLYDALKPYEDAQPDSSLEIYRYVTIDALRLSDYNALARMQGAPELSLAQDQYAVVSVMENRRAIVDALLADGAVFELGGRRYTPAMSSSLTTALETSFGSGAPVYYILPDEAAVSLKPVMTALSANYSGDPDETDQKLISLVEELMENGVGQAGPDIEFASRTLVYQAVMGLKASLLFVSIYLGVIFLIASAAVLALQQLSEMSDNIGRYRLLRKLGVENRMMNRSILMQIFLSFFLPLSLAIVHSIVGIAAFNRSLNMFDSAAVLRGTIFSGLFLLAIYGGYFLFTYFSCKGMIKSGGRAE